LVKKYNIRKVALLYGNDDVFTTSGFDTMKEVSEKRKLAILTVYEKAYGKKPDPFAAQAYDALHVVAKALKAAGGRTGTACETPWRRPGTSRGSCGPGSSSNGSGSPARDTGRRREASRTATRGGWRSRGRWPRG